MAFLLFAIGFALLGLFASVNIYIAKKKKAPLACPRSSRCDMIIHSTYATTLGVSNDILGIVYYTLVLVALITLSFLPVLFFWFFVIASIGFLFSCYLVLIQIIVFRSWCAWCALSAFASIALFLITSLAM